MGRLTAKGSKRKGDGYERELAKAFNDFLYGGDDVIFRAPLSGGGRTNQFGGGSADLCGTPDVWVEAKRTEKFAPYAAMEQAETGIEGRRSDEMPVVISRRNGMKTEESMVVMRFEDWMVLYSAYLKINGHRLHSPEDDIGAKPQIYSPYEELDDAEEIEGK